MSRYFVTGWRDSLPVPRVLLETEDRAHAERRLQTYREKFLALTHYQIIEHEPNESDRPTRPLRVHRTQETP